MNKKIKTLLKEWLPPAILRWIIRMKGIGNQFYGNYKTWHEAESKCTGYNQKEILDKVLVATLKVKNGEAICERDSVVFDKVEYSWPVTSALMWVAARSCGKLNVLDFGGSLGSSYFQNKIFLQTIEDVRWNIVEQAHYVDAGIKHIQNDHLRFYKAIEDCMKESQPNIILLSGVLQYLEDPADVIQKLTATKASCLIIDRTPFSNSDIDKILVQKVPSSIYSASYPMRVFSKEKYLELLKSDWKLIALITCPEGNVTSTSGFKFSFEGMLLELRQ